ncbi:hypothetical protein OAA99_01925 [Omnitrophica bacterium]|nr:hypothetical protein [Candidatus Omnitrophota bacterium]
MVKLKSRHSFKKAHSYNKLASMGHASRKLVSRLYNPIDAMNRFLNLALQTTDEDSQSRQFLLESKVGLRRMSLLLRKLDTYTKKIEKASDEISRKRS